MAKARYGYHWFHLGDNLRLKIDHPDYDMIAINVLYTKGGSDPLNLDHDGRGYYLSVLPIRDYNGRCRGVRSAGAKILLKAVGRRSDKADAAAVAKGVGIMPMVVDDVCAKLGAKYDWSDLKAIGG
jgi:hypothetical protein